MQLGPWESRDEEKRALRIELATARRALQIKQESNKKLREKLKELEDKCKELERQRDRYRNMIFKANVKPQKEVKEESDEEIRISASMKRKRGGQMGHAGRGRKLPGHIDEVRRVYLERCPDCGTPLGRSKGIDKHTIEDIPPPEAYRAQVIRYEIELQYCKKCKRPVKAKVPELIPKCRLGINTLSYVLINKYMARSTWDTIAFSLSHFYGIEVSKGALVEMAHRAAKWLERKYEQILGEIRASPVKHADETGWRVEGINSWLWGFFTKEHAYYAIKESRGKGVPAKILDGSHPDDVLVRDDYGGYRKLPLKHQSCWAHLLSDSSEAANQPGASAEVGRLHRKLKQIYASLGEIIAQVFEPAERQAAYDHFAKELQYIIKTELSPSRHQENPNAHCSSRRYFAYCLAL